MSAVCQAAEIRIEDYRMGLRGKPKKAIALSPSRNWVLLQVEVSNSTFFWRQCTGILWEERG